MTKAEIPISILLALSMSGCFQAKPAEEFDSSNTASPDSTQATSLPDPLHSNRNLSTLPQVESSSEVIESEYPWHENITATVFWVGEKASSANDNISNVSSAWNSDWVKKFGGIDDPINRNPENPYHPASFTPKENPFYVALPAAENDENGRILGARERSYWADEKVSEDESLFKNRWVEIVRALPDGNSLTCFGQWEDVGPTGSQDSNFQYDYVFDKEKPETKFGMQAGIDISPACAIKLGLSNVENSSALVKWRFINAVEVPIGPETEIITSSGPDW